ncbi:hypothetical protein KFE98_18455 [bacterium SCSIO 12741]|nr:hypothetical protein KFE98_18455 [bacterium SCSIO 12741]
MLLPIHPTHRSTDVTLKTVASPYLVTKCFSCAPEHENRLKQMLLETIPQALLAEGCQEHLVFRNPLTREWIVFSSWEEEIQYKKHQNNTTIEIQLQELIQSGIVSSHPLIEDTFERIE